MSNRAEVVTPLATELDPTAIQTEILELVGRGSFKFRELSVEENDTCREAATAKDGTFNGRTMMRLMIVQSAIEPKLTLADLAKLPQRVYAKIVDFVNDINDGATLQEKDDQEPDAGNS